MTIVVQVSPSFPPATSGVGDYSFLLMNSMKLRGFEVVTVIPGRGVWSHGNAIGIPARSEALAMVLESSSRVVLHFSGYGYDRWGLCRWLVEGLERWKASGLDRRLVTMFHEVYATGPVWRSSFWSASGQRRIARELGRLSDTVLVSSLGGRAQLAGLLPMVDIRVLPIFSTIGESEAPQELSKRMKRAVVFGSQSRRERVYEALQHVDAQVSHKVRALGVSEILDVGPRMQVPERIVGCPVTALGPLPAKEVSVLLTDVRIGLFDYYGHVITKSSIAAAYFAHRLVVVNTSTVNDLPPDLKEGREFLDLNSFEFGDVDLQAIADAGFEWYHSHGIAATTETFLAAFA